MTALVGTSYIQPWAGDPLQQLPSQLCSGMQKEEEDFTSFSQTTSLIRVGSQLHVLRQVILETGLTADWFSMRPRSPALFATRHLPN